MRPTQAAAHIVSATKQISGSNVTSLVSMVTESASALSNCAKPVAASSDARLAHFRQAIKEEAQELSDFAEALGRRTPSRKNAFDRPIDEMILALGDACSPTEAEVALEACARRLRRRWLDAASSAANGSYRSPLAAQMTQTATGPSMNFGYERELQPIELARYWQGSEKNPFSARVGAWVLRYGHT
jgi:hypothetical protein